MATEQRPAQLLSEAEAKLNQLLQSLGQRENGGGSASTSAGANSMAEGTLRVRTTVRSRGNSPTRIAWPATTSREPRVGAPAAKLTEHVHDAHLAAVQLGAQVQALQAQLQAQKRQLSQQQEVQQATSEQATEHAASLQAQLHAALRRAQHLEDERLDTLNTMATMASQSLLMEREKSDLQRIKADLVSQKKELEAARAFFTTQQREVEAAKQAAQRAALLAGDIAALNSFYSELDRLALELERVLRGRAMFVFGASLEMAGPDAGSTARDAAMLASALRSPTHGAAATATLRGVGGKVLGSSAAAVAPDADELAPGLFYVQELRKLVSAARAQLLALQPSTSGSAGASTSAGGAVAQAGATTVIQQLREMQGVMMRLLSHLATDSEADAAKLMAREARITELQQEVSRLREEAAKHAALALQVGQECSGGCSWPRT